MKKEATIIAALYTLFLVFGSPLGMYALEEQMIVFGERAGWSVIANRTMIKEKDDVRPYPVLVLSSVIDETYDPTLDMWLTFDETSPELFRDRKSNYKVTASQGVYTANPRLSRIGPGAALFSTGVIYVRGAEELSIVEPLRVTPENRNALFASERIVQDFSIEFWLFPTNIENGEHIISWTATHRNNRNEFSVQRIQCIFSRNRVNWTFSDLFALNSDKRLAAVNLSGFRALVPKTWSHHLIRFDADTGLFEYLVNGQIEDLVHVTETGREGSQVYFPLIGDGGRFTLGSSFLGMIDELKLWNRYVSEPQLYKYSQLGGKIETGTIDLGDRNSTIVRVEADGGTAFSAGGALNSRFEENSTFRFADHSTINFFIRASNSPYTWGEWQPFIPGRDLAGVSGRYLQLAGEFYPSADGETTPYLDAVRIIYRPFATPRPPNMLTAVAQDGAVILSWRQSPDLNAGYLVFYGTASGNYFGSGSSAGPSPIDVGTDTSIRLEGLNNGTLYYFAIAAYNRSDPVQIGIYSYEVNARPLRSLINE